ncbi:MAG: carbohydrate kinase family protein [Acidobacteriota bacterium]
MKPVRYRALCGTGGIGAGSFFAISGNATLGREESRAGRFLDRRDYCKLHIIAHYTRALLGPEFTAIAIGRVGADDTGARLVAEMEAAGLDVRYVERAPGEQTLFSFCFVYPDGSGGNLTTEDSASSKVDAAYVARAEDDFRRNRGQGIALAAPEVPLEARAALLRLGTRYEFFRAASFTSQESPEALAMGLLKEVDLVALNRSESEAVLGASFDPDRTIERLRRENPALRVSITAGADGSWYADTGAAPHFAPALRVPVETTAGAGDAHLGALLAGIAAGLDPAAAHELASLVAAYSVTSPHTIHPNVTHEALRAFAARYGSGG